MNRLGMNIHDNRGYKAESNIVTMTLHNKGLQQRQKTMFIHTNYGEAAQLPMDHEHHSCIFALLGT